MITRQLKAIKPLAPTEILRTDEQVASLITYSKLVATQEKVDELIRVVNGIIDILRRHHG